MEDWAEVHRLFHREGLAKAAIARRLGMSRTTVDRLLALREPPRYVRAPRGLAARPVRERIAALLAADPTVGGDGHPRAPAALPGTRAGSRSSRTTSRGSGPTFLAARAFQRTTYLPGEIGQVDWWHTGVQIPVGEGRTREAFGLVTTLPFSARPRDHVHPLADDRRLAGRRSPAASSAWAACPRRLVFDNDASSSRRRAGGRARLHDEVAALLGALRRAGRPAPAPADVEGPASSGRSATSRRASCRCATFADLDDLQAQHDAWATDVAYRRHIRRLGGRVGRRAGPSSARSSPRCPTRCPTPTSSTEARAGKDAFVRVLGVDYSVPPAFVGRRVARPGLARRRSACSCEGVEIARHRRSFVPADVVLAPAHGRAIRLAREARDRLADGEPELPPVDLGRYDALFEVPA